MSCDIGEVTEKLENEQSLESNTIFRDYYGILSVYFIILGA